MSSEGGEAKASCTFGRCVVEVEKGDTHHASSYVRGSWVGSGATCGSPIVFHRVPYLTNDRTRDGNSVQPHGDDTPSEEKGAQDHGQDDHCHGNGNGNSDDRAAVAACDDEDDDDGGCSHWFGNDYVVMVMVVMALKMRRRDRTAAAAMMSSKPEAPPASRT